MEVKRGEGRCMEEKVRGLRMEIEDDIRVPLVVLAVARNAAKTCCF